MDVNSKSSGDPQKEVESNISKSSPPIPPPLEEPNFEHVFQNQKSTQRDEAEPAGRAEAAEDKFRRTTARKENFKENFYDYATTNREQTLTYILLILGLLLLFFNDIIGGLMIGAVAGYHFSNEIIYYIRNMKLIVGGENQLRYITLTALLLGLFISAPGIFIGAAIVAAFRYILSNKSD